MRERLQRLAQVVARGREEAALRLVGAVGRLPRRAQLRLDAPAVGDVADRRRDEVAVAVADRAQADLDGELRPVAAQRAKSPRPLPIGRACMLAPVAAPVADVPVAEPLRQQILHGPANDLAGLVAEQRGYLAIREQH